MASNVKYISSPTPRNQRQSATSAPAPKTQARQRSSPANPLPTSTAVKASEKAQPHQLFTAGKEISAPSTARASSRVSLAKCKSTDIQNIKPLSSSSLSSSKTGSQRLTRELGREVVELHVGNKKRKELTIHKKLLCESSETFAEYFASDHEAAKEGKAYLSQVDPDAVSALVSFLYWGSLPVEKQSSFALSPLTSLYLLAERARIPDLMDQTMDAIIASHKANGSCYATIPTEHIYQQTAKQSKLRRFCPAEASIVTQHYPGDEWKGAVYTRLSEETCTDFSRDVFKHHLKHGKKTKDQAKDWTHALDDLDPCLFHCHGHGKVCYLKRIA